VAHSSEPGTVSVRRENRSESSANWRVRWPWRQLLFFALMQHATAQAERSVVMRAPMTFEGHGRGFKWAEQKGIHDAR
jgi:hypothetical protein